MRSTHVPVAEMGSGHEKEYSELPCIHRCYSPEDLDEFDNKNKKWKVVKLGNLFSTTPLKRYEGMPDVESWDTFEVSKEEVLASQKELAG